METPALFVRDGYVTALRLFDIAYAIDLPRVESLWASAGKSGSSRSSLAHTPTKALTFEVSRSCWRSSIPEASKSDVLL